MIGIIILTVMFIVLSFLYVKQLRANNKLKTEIECEYCEKTVPTDKIKYYKGWVCPECYEQNKVIDSFDELPKRFGLGK